MSVGASTVTPDPVSGAGKVWQAMVSDLLADEFDRRKTLEGRGATLMTASVSLVTLIFALTVILTGKDHVFANRYAVYFLLAALISFVISAVIAIVVQTRGFNYDVIKRQTLERLTDPNAPFGICRPPTPCAPTSASTSKRSAACATATTRWPHV
jgi:hypothetical protein